MRLNRVVSFPELAQTQNAAYHVFSGSEPTFTVVVNLEDARDLGIQIRLLQEAGSLLRPVGDARPLEPSLAREEGVSQVLKVPVQIPEVQAVTSFVCVLQTLEKETGKTTTLRPPFRIKAYPSKKSYFTRIESAVKAVLHRTGSKAVQIFGPAEGPLVRLLKACEIPTEDLGERPPERWEPGIVYFGEFPETAQDPLVPPSNKSLLRVVLDTDADTGSRFIQLNQEQTRIRLQLSSESFSPEDNPEFLHLFLRSLQQLNLPRD